MNFKKNVRGYYEYKSINIIYKKKHVNRDYYMCIENSFSIYKVISEVGV